MVSVALQPSLEDVGTGLRDAVFCVLDLETTGTTHEAAITEVGAVKVQGGEVIGEFHTLVNPGESIPAMITVLTGITNQMVAPAPQIDEVLPAFLEFSKNCVLVAHNARFDIGFLKRACAQLDYRWPSPIVIDTVALARHALMPGEVPNVKLETLARHFKTTEQPSHRALDDARATVDVLHRLIERVGNLGVLSVEDLQEFQHRVSKERRSKRGWANDLPEKPGVYYFYADRPGQEHEVLYVGKSVNIRRRVRSYFTSGETRRRMDEMVRVASGVKAVECATDLEAEIRELRMIEAHAPRYNRRSKRQRNLAWIKLTHETWPRLSIVYAVKDDQATYLGPFSSREAAEATREGLYEIFPVRQCTGAITRAAQTACALYDLQKCSAPCLGGANLADYSALTEDIRQAMTTTVYPLLELAGRKMAVWSAEQRYEEAERITSRMRHYCRATTRLHRIQALTRCPLIVAAEWDGDSLSHPGWQIHVIRHGGLAAAAVAAPGESAREVANQAVLASQTITMGPHDLPTVSTEECERVAAWLERPGVRLMEIDGEWAWPVQGGINAEDLPRFTLGTQVARDDEAVLADSRAPGIQAQTGPDATQPDEDVARPEQDVTYPERDAARPDEEATRPERDAT